MASRLLILVFSAVLYGFNTVVTESTSHDYCLDEKFTAACDSEGEIIMIDSALYGRMEFGTCVLRDYGYIGCHVDVTQILANKCSGRKSCEVVNFETLFSSYNGCPGDLKSYLKASFSCVKVTEPLDPNQCRLGYVQPAGASGFLASAEQRWGTSSCPWQIHGEKGQLINLTLHDYSDYGASSDQNPSLCRHYLTVSESDMVKTVVSCSTENRHRNIYLSSDNEINIIFTLDNEEDSSVSFLVEYQVAGCPSPTLPLNTHFVYHEDGSLTVQCNFTTESWTLKCSKGKWDGRLGNCSAKIAAVPDNMIPIGMSIVIIVGVALLVCTGVLLVGFLIIYCKKRSTHKQNIEERRLFATYSKVHNNATIVNSRTKHASLEKSRVGYSPLTKTRTLRVHTGAGEYTHIWEVKHPIPVATPEVPKSHMSFHSNTMKPSKSSPTMTSVQSPTLSRPKQDFQCECETNVGIPRLPTFSTFKPDGQLYECPRFKAQTSQCSSHSSQSSPLYFEIDRKRATNHYST